MHSKKLALFFMFLLIVMLIYIFVDNDTIVVIDDLQLPVENEPNRAEGVLGNRESRDKVGSNEDAKVSKIPENLPAQLEVLEYDDDPVVNANSIRTNNLLCIRHLNSQKNYSQFFARFKMKLSKKQKEIHEKFAQRCEKLNKSHPEYHLTDSKFLTQLKNNTIATSQWGEILKGEVDPADLTDAEISDLLKQNNLNMLNEAPKYFQKYYQEVVHWDLETVLQNHQYDYVELVQHYTHQLYLCQQGADCSANTPIMTMLCYLNENGCGLNYQQYLQNVLTSGQNSDIQLALRYLESQYQR